jgi:hypothetical protein
MSSRLDKGHPMFRGLPWAVIPIFPRVFSDCTAGCTRLSQDLLVRLLL